MSFNDNDESRPNVEDRSPDPPRIREYTRTQPAEILFEARLRDPNDLIHWEVYGGQRIPSLYGPTVVVADGPATGEQGLGTRSR
jgi:hypothetical protein